MKYLSILLFFIPLFSAAQKNLVIEGTSPGLYITHTVAPKENFYSIGRMYNISPKDEIAPFNKLDLSKGLALGQVVKIPLTATNFIQSGAPAAGEVLIPVYHIVKEKESLYHISNDYNKVPIASLKKWNKISGDGANNGTNLIVGYLKVKKDLSPLAANADAVQDLGSEVSDVEPTATQTTKPVKPVVKDVKKEDVVVTKPAKKDETDVKKEEKKPEVKPKEDISTEVITNTANDFKGGVFKNDFDKQVRDKDVVKESGAAATFKSTSGWEDGKYYCMHNTASPGTIVKITNNVTGKSVYAKVLDVMMPDIKQNNGLLIRLSNAAAEGLGVTDESKFDCTLEYVK